MTMASVARSLLAVVMVGAVAVGAGALYLRSLPGSTANSDPFGGTANNTTSSVAPVPEAPKLEPVERAKAPDEECVTHATSFDGLPMTVERSASISTSVVIGTVEEVGTARWRTEGEKTPTEKWELSGDAVMRLVRIRVDDNLAGSSSDGSLVVWIPGGTIGCHVFEVGGYPSDLNVGEQYAFFLDAGQAPLAHPAGTWKVVEMWPVDEDIVTSAAEGKLPVAEVATRAEKDLPRAP